MELAFITLRFDSPGEQLYVEESVNAVVWEREVWPADSDCSSWTEFDITGCRAKDLVIFDELETSWNNLSDEQREAWEKKAEE